MADNFLSKSFLFEVVDSATEKINTSFTLVIPPSSYSIKEPQRLNITKTFGNAFIDDYGPDNLQMVIKGITGTAHAFPTFRTSGLSAGGSTFESIRVGEDSPNEGYRGREAFYVFRDEIMRYKDNYASNFDQKELRVYDLADEQAYKCALLEFSLDRNADKPFHYPYMISLFVYAKLGSKEAYNPTSISLAKQPFEALDSVDESATSIEERFKVFDNIQNIRNNLALFKQSAARLRAQLTTWLLKARTVVESPLLITKQLLDILKETSTLMKTAYEQGKLTYENYASALETIQDQYRECFGIYAFSIGQGSQLSREETLEIKTGIDYSDAANPVPTAELNTFSFDGVVTYTIKGGDTLQIIAQNELGDSDLWPYIASVNTNITSNDDLEVGEEIYIPVSTDPGLINKDNFIVTEDEARDPYGTDISIDSDGNIALLESNDVSLVSGVANVIQAVDIRLATEVGSMIKQTAYGLLAQPGLAGTSEAVSYIRMSIKNALIKDPRISQVKNIGVNLDTDAIQIKADIILIGREKSLPVEVIV
jgi:nucleoid-associated protein YgaU